MDIDLYDQRENLETRVANGVTQIFCLVRKTWMTLSPEEVVRQLFILYCINEVSFSLALISVEKSITVNQLTRRYDIVLHDRQAAPYILVECKAPHVPIDQAVLRQATQYNTTLTAPYLIVTNGIMTYGFGIDHEEQSFSAIDQMPDLPVS